MITQERLKEFVVYCPETGVFSWVKSPNPRADVGREAGYICKGYRMFSLNGLKQPSHRWAFLYMTGMFPVGMVDHINRIPLDNRWNNLREATKSQNAINSRIYKTNTSGLRGVKWSPLERKWKVSLSCDGRRHYVGTFSDRLEAAAAYNSAAKKHHGGFAQLNAVP